MFRKEQGMKPGNWVLPAQGEDSVIAAEILIKFGRLVSDNNLVGYRIVVRFPIMCDLFVPSSITRSKAGWRRDLCTRSGHCGVTEG